jgi:hypothetical protein
MFGILDYRAAKLFLILFGIPNYILRIFLIFGVPYLAYLLTKDFINGEGYSPFAEILIFLVAFAITTIITELINLFLYEKVFKFIFNLLVDVIPSEGRNTDEAMIVVYDGEVARDLFFINGKKVSEWTDSDIEKVIKHNNFWFRDNARERFYMIRDFFTEHYPEALGKDNINIDHLQDKFKENNIHADIKEHIVSTKQYRNIIYQLLFVIYFSNELNSDGFGEFIIIAVGIIIAYFGTKKIQDLYGNLIKKLKMFFPNKNKKINKDDTNEEKSFNWFVGVPIFLFVIVFLGELAGYI